MKRLNKVKAPINSDGITQGKIYNVIDSTPNDITGYHFTIIDDRGIHIKCDLNSCERLGGDSWIVVSVETGHIPDIENVQINWDSLSKRERDKCLEILLKNNCKIWNDGCALKSNNDVNYLRKVQIGGEWFVSDKSDDCTEIDYEQFIEYYSLGEEVKDSNDIFFTPSIRGKIVEYKGEYSDKTEVYNPQSHYDNAKGSLYKIASERGWNSYIFDIVKRLERGGKKDPLEQEINKSIDVLKVWLQDIKQELKIEYE